MRSLFDVQIYRSSSGKFPFSEWLVKLDKTSRAIIDVRIALVRVGNFGDCKSLRGTNGLFELRINFGPGFRVYYGMHNDTIIILLCGGDKKSQERDIIKAKEYWNNYLKHLNEKGENEKKH